MRVLNEVYSAMPWEWHQLRQADRGTVVAVRVFNLLMLDLALREGRPVCATRLLEYKMAQFGLSMQTVASLRGAGIHGLIDESSANEIGFSDMDSLLERAELFGAFMQVRDLMGQFRCSCDQFFANYDLNEDGTIKLEGKSIQELHWAVASGFNNIVTSGLRCVKRMGDTLIHCFCGKDSSEYKSWHDATEYAYDNDLDYAALYYLRNCIEHGFVLISIVNVDLSKGTLGLAINLDAGMLDRSGIEKADVRRRLLEFRNERIKRGESPWLSVGKALKRWAHWIESFYVSYLNVIANSKRPDCAEDDKLSGLLEQGYDAVLWQCAGNGTNDKRDLTYQEDRLYNLPQTDYIPLLQDEARKSICRIANDEACGDEMAPELEKALEAIDKWPDDSDATGPSDIA